MLHPRLKLSYFKTAHWNDEWIKTTEKVIKDEFERSYVMDTTDDDMVVRDVAPDPHRTSKVCFHLYVLCYIYYFGYLDRQCI